MARRSKNRTLLQEEERGGSFDSLSSVSTSQNDDTTEGQDSVNEEYGFKKCCSAGETKTISCSSSLSSDRNDGFTSGPSLKQGLFVLAVYLLGCCTGVAHVKYGFGKEDSESSFSTSQLYPQNSASPTVVVNDETPKTRNKQILLNQDNNGFKQRRIPTLFGVEYDSVIGIASNDDTETNKTATSAIQVDSSWNYLGSNKRITLAPSETKMIQSVAENLHKNIPDLEERAARVSWGGPHNDVPATNWWSPKTSDDPSLLSGLDGGHTLYAYLFIMKWNPNPKFPFRLCGENGCPPEWAVAHTLEWREKYKPWLVPPSLLKENTKGYAYHRGLSPAASTSEKHSIVWLRLGGIAVQDNLAFFRGILHAADRAIEEALIQSNGETGKFNVVIDCAGFSMSGTPTAKALKQAVTMLQDHYPNRLGMIHLASLSRAGEMFLNVVLRLITKEVRDKVKILPNSDKAKTLAILKTVVDEEYIPDWLGGTDTYRFNAEEYYPEHLRCTEEEAHEFLTTMPYHAK